LLTSSISADAGADDGLGADSGAFALEFAFQPDERGQPEGDEQLGDLPDALPESAEERRVGCQPEIHRTS
jgi:hypothetical protein